MHIILFPLCMGDESDDDEKDIRCSPIHAMYEMFANFILSFNEFISINSVLNYLVYSVYIYIYIYIYTQHFILIFYIKTT